MKKYIYNHVSESTAYEVEDYPWGFRLRTKQRYWIETQDKKNGGQRFVYQTLNPKTGTWCKPKKSTYNVIEILYIDEKGHVKREVISRYGMGEEWKEYVNEFIEIHKDNLTEFQRKEIKIAYAQNEIIKEIKWTVKPSPIGPVSLFSNDPEEKEKMKKLLKEQEENKIIKEKENRKINHAINIVHSKLDLFS